MHSDGYVESLVKFHSPSARPTAGVTRRRSREAGLVGGTRQRHFDGTNFKSRKTRENAQTPTTTVLVLLQGSGSIMKSGHGRSLVGWSSRDRRAAGSPCPYLMSLPTAVEGSLETARRTAAVARAHLYYKKRRSKWQLVVKHR